MDTTKVLVAVAVGLGLAFLYERSRRKILDALFQNKDTKDKDLELKAEQMKNVALIEAEKNNQRVSKEELEKKLGRELSQKEVEEFWKDK